MNILGIDTTSKFLCLGLYSGGRLSEYNLEAGRSISGLLAMHIQRVLKAEGLSVSDIDYFACGLGPGSFTGMRMGLATIKGLSLIGNKPVVGVSTLDILAFGAGIRKQLIVPAVDAKRGLIYCASYSSDKGKLKRKSGYALLNLEEFVGNFKQPVLVFGDAVGIYEEAMRAKLKNVSFLDKDYWFPKAGNLIELALEKIKNKDLSDAFTVNPIYLYSKECQIKSR